MATAAPGAAPHALRYLHACTPARGHRREKCDDPAYWDLILQVIASNGKLSNGLTPVSVQRLRQVIGQAITNLAPGLPETRLTHPIAVLKAIAAEMTEALLVATYGPELKEMIKARSYSSNVLSLSSGRPQVLVMLFEVLLTKAGSSEFTVANNFASSLDTVDSQLANTLTDEQAFRLVAAVSRAADIGAFSSGDVRTAKFASAPNLRTKATANAAGHGAQATAILNEIGITGEAGAFVVEPHGHTTTALRQRAEQ